MNAGTWQQRLATATKAEEVMAIAREFVAFIDPATLAKLPEPCKPPRLSEPQDVANCAYDLMRYNRESEDAQVAETIRILAEFFAQASGRLSELAARGTAAKLLSKLFG